MVLAEGTLRLANAGSECLGLVETRHDDGNLGERGLISILLGEGRPRLERRPGCRARLPDVGWSHGPMLPSSCRRVCPQRAPTTIMNRTTIPCTGTANRAFSPYSASACTVAARRMMAA